MKKTIIFVWDQNPYNIRIAEGLDNPKSAY